MRIFPFLLVAILLVACRQTANDSTYITPAACGELRGIQREVLNSGASCMKTETDVGRILGVTAALQCCVPQARP